MNTQAQPITSVADIWTPALIERMARDMDRGRRLLAATPLHRCNGMAQAVRKVRR